MPAVIVPACTCMRYWNGHQSLEKQECRSWNDESCLCWCNVEASLINKIVTVGQVLNQVKVLFLVSWLAKFSRGGYKLASGILTVFENLIEEYMFLMDGFCVDWLDQYDLNYGYECVCVCARARACVCVTVTSVSLYICLGRGGGGGGVVLNSAESVLIAVFLCNC